MSRTSELHQQQNEAAVPTKKEKTPLEKINKRAWSASSINKLMNQPAAWILSYVYNVRGSGSAAMSRGLAAEVGYDAFCHSEFGSIEDAVSEATRYFNKNTALQGGDEAKRDKERNALDGFIRQAIEAFEPYGFPTSSQGKLHLKMDGVQDPWIGYDDYNFAPLPGDPRPITIDLKTTHRMPSKINDMHRRQMGLYQLMKPDHRILICYCTSKKHAIYEMTMEEAIEIGETLKIAAQTGEKMINLFDNPKELSTLYAPDFDSFYFGDTITRNEARRVWGY